MRDLATVVEGVAATRARIERACARAGRATHEVELLAAVKYLSLEELPLLAEAGVPLVGENRTDQLAAKQAATGDRFTWDFIGHLQSRKARDVVGRVRLVHAVESDSLAAAIDRAASAPQPVLVQVNTARDPGKYGVLPEEVDAFLERLAALPGLEVRGLMTMPALADDDPASSRGAFAALREPRRPLRRPLGGRAPLRRALHGHEPGLRGRDRGGRDHRPARRRPLRPRAHVGGRRRPTG